MSFSGSLAVKGMAGVAVLIAVIWFGMVPMVGAPTVTLKVVNEVFTLSLALMVMVAILADQPRELP